MIPYRILEKRRRGIGEVAALDKLEGFACRPRYGVWGYGEAGLRQDRKGCVVEHTANARPDLEA